MRIEKHHSNTKLSIFIILVLSISCGLLYFRYINESHPKKIPSEVSKTIENGSATSGRNSSYAILDTSDDALNTENAPSKKSQSITEWSINHNIGLISPTNTDVIDDSLTISGVTTNDNIYFRLYDNLTGMIGEHSLSINKSGTFNGVLKINTQATKGQLDVYSLDKNGKEIDNISVEIKFEN